MRWRTSTSSSSSTVPRRWRRVQASTLMSQDKVGLTDAFGALSTELEPSRVIALPSDENHHVTAKYEILASNGGMSNPAKRDLIDRGSMVLSSANTIHEL